MSAPLLRDAARTFFRGQHNPSLSGSSSGLSGSSFARVEEARGASWCLRRWPTGFEERRLGFIHRALLHCREGDFTGVPTLAKTEEGDTVLDLEGHPFDAQEWLAGDPLSGTLKEPTPNVVQPLEPQILESLTTAVARFHRSAAELAPERDRETPLSARRTESARDGRVPREALLADAQARAEGGDRRAALRWLELLPEALALAEAILSDQPGGARSVSTLCHSDLWAPHVFFAGTTFVGFADFGSLCFGSPAVDLAQLIVHFNGWTARDTVVDAYEGVSPLGGEDKAVLPAAAVADLAWEGYWSLGLLYGEGHSLGPAQKEAHETNLRMLLGSLELLAADIEEASG